MVKVTIFLEGGGNTSQEDRLCCRAFHRLLDTMGIRRRPKLVACGGRSSAYDRFRSEWERAGDDEDMLLLLVDSEDALSGGKWEHVARRPGDRWEKPDGATEGHLWFMTQCMETWVVADRETLRRVFAGCLIERALPPLRELEARPKADVQARLERATARCDRARRYTKGKRSYQVVAELRAPELEKHLPCFRALAAHLRILLGEE